MQLTANQSKVAKEKLNKFFYKHFKKAISDNILETNKDYIIGAYPHWKYESKLSERTSGIYQFNIENVRLDEDVIVANIHFHDELFNYVYETYNICLAFDVVAFPDDEDDYIAIDQSMNFSKIKSFEISYKTFFDELDLNLMEELLVDFEKIIFLSALKN